MTSPEDRPEAGHASGTTSETSGADHADQAPVLPGTGPADDGGPHLNLASLADHLSNSNTASLDAMSGFSLELSIDSDRSDADSSLGTQYSGSSSRSVNSSVYDFVAEFGRTFHKYKQGKYYLPNDEQEQTRLDLQHAIAKEILNGRLGDAPIAANRSARVLDIGTGTGIWAIEFAEQNPAADVLGTDLSPIQPEYVPPNCRFEIDDVEDEWVFSYKFDYVHARYIVPFLKDVQKLMHSIYDNLNPGGYVEFFEGPMLFQSIDNTLEGKPMKRWNQLMIEGVKKVGREPLVALDLRKMMTEAGFTNITEKRVALPINPWAKGERLKLLGAMEQENLLEVADGITKSIFTKALGWSLEEVEVLLVDVRKNLSDRSIHAYLPVVCIYAQKPPSS